MPQCVRPNLHLLHRRMDYFDVLIEEQKTRSSLKHIHRANHLFITFYSKWDSNQWGFRWTQGATSNPAQLGKQQEQQWWSTQMPATLSVAHRVSNPVLNTVRECGCNRSSLFRCSLEPGHQYSALCCGIWGRTTWASKWYHVWGVIYSWQSRCAKDKNQHQPCVCPC